MVLKLLGGGGIAAGVVPVTGEPGLEHAAPVQLPFVGMIPFPRAKKTLCCIPFTQLEMQTPWFAPWGQVGHAWQGARLLKSTPWGHEAPLVQAPGDGGRATLSQRVTVHCPSVVCWQVVRGLLGNWAGHAARQAEVLPPRVGRPTPGGTGRGGRGGIPKGGMPKGGIPKGGMGNTGIWARAAPGRSRSSSGRRQERGAGTRGWRTRGSAMGSERGRGCWRGRGGEGRDREWRGCFSEEPGLAGLSAQRAGAAWSFV